MSYNPNSSYGYSTNPNYYAEDPEEFIPEYTDSEALSDHPQILQTNQPNVTEIYTRNDPGMVTKRQVVANQLGYNQIQGQYMQQYYYENPAAHAARRLTTVPYQDYGQSYDPRIHQYCPLTTSSLHDTTYESAGYRNVNMAPSLPLNRPRNYQETTQHTAVQKQHNAKRHPIKVGTPKYYRKAPSNAVYKRPSALCLPVASQPDPAVMRKHKKPSPEIQYVYTNNLPMANDTTDTQLLDRPNEQIATDHKVGSEGDFNLKVSKLDEMFEEIEKGDETSLEKNKNDMLKFAKFLKPRVPPSIKSRRENTQSKPTKSEAIDEKSTSEDGKSGKTEEKVEDESPADSIDRLLNQLKKCELAVCSDDIDKTTRKNEKQSNEISPKKVNPIQKKKNISSTSFNYEEITNQMKKSQSQMKTFEPDLYTERSNHKFSKQLKVSMSTSRNFSPLDDHCALELHRSKSYIVDLIDRALSKELGTVPNQRNNKEFNDMSPRKAIDMMNRHSCGKSDKDLSVEIATALTDSIISNATAPEDSEINHLPSSSSPSKGKVCCCNAEEPTYIKQLKQLRWGHLKHIQREVRRLEDLERFLDSCSLNPISEI